jgi:hypothetical protein
VTAWKDLERRICTALGGRRGGPTGASVSDCVNTPFAVEVKRSSRRGPPVLAAWIIQARTNARREGRPWLVVVAGHNDRRPTATLDFYQFAEIAQQAGLIPTPIEIQETPAKPGSFPNDRVPLTSGPAPPAATRQAGTATLKGANPMHHTETTTSEPQPEPTTPEPQPDPEPNTGDNTDNTDDTDDDDE